MQPYVVKSPLGARASKGFGHVNEWQPRHRRARRTIKIAAVAITPLVIAAGTYVVLTDLDDPTATSSDSYAQLDTSDFPSPSGEASEPTGSERTSQSADPSDEPETPSDDGDASGATSEPPEEPSPSPTATPTQSPSPTPTPTPTDSDRPTPRPTTPVEPTPRPTPPPPPPTEPPPPQPKGDVELELQLVDATNSLRTLGCPDLRVDSRLTAAARAHSADMRVRGFFGHENPDGADAEDRAEAAGYPDAGDENLARGIEVAGGVMVTWLLDSDEGRNLLDCDYVSVGVGVDSGPDGTWWTMMFGYS